MPSSSLAVHVRHVSKRFIQKDYFVDALKDVSFDARVNELLMIVGPSGCGKTTLLSIIAGTLRFDKGEVDVFNTSLHNLTESEVTIFRRHNVGFIFQQFHLIPTLTCLENVAVPLLLEGFSMKDAKEKGAVVIEKLGLKGKEYAKSGSLSGGQQQRIAIARAIVHEPRLVICDEPTSSLDLDSGIMIMEILSDIAKTDDRCVIIVTHDSRIFKYANRITKMNDGRCWDENNDHIS